MQSINQEVSRMIALLPTHKTILTHVDFSKTWTVES